VQAFNVTFQASNNVNRYSNGIKLGGVYKENNDIQIFERYAKGYLFGADYYPRVFNGQVFYEVGTVSQPPVPATPLPTKAPTPVPATPLPTKVPVVDDRWDIGILEALELLRCNWITPNPSFILFLKRHCLYWREALC